MCRQQTTTMTKFWYAVQITDYRMDVVDGNAKLRRITDGLIVWTTEELTESDVGRGCYTRQNIDCADFGQLRFDGDGGGSCFHYYDTMIEAPEASLKSYKRMQLCE